MHQERDDSEFERRWQKRPSIAAYPHAREIFELFPNKQFTWRRNTSYCSSAENLYQVRGVEDVREALKYVLRHRSDPYCPEIYTPYDLDMKWDKLVAYSLKHQ